MAFEEEMFRNSHKDPIKITAETLPGGAKLLVAKNPQGPIDFKAIAKSSKKGPPDDPQSVVYVTCEGGWSDPKIPNPEIETACRSLFVK
jgi:hypothetical protein